MSNNLSRRYNSDSAFVGNNDFEEQSILLHNPLPGPPSDPQSRYAIPSDNWKPIIPTPSRRLYSDFDDSDRMSTRSESGFGYGGEFVVDKNGEDGYEDLETKMDWKDQCKRFFSPMRMKYYFPITTWLPRYKVKDLPMDLLAGLAVAMLLIPQGIAYAIIAGLPPNYGLYAGIVPLIMYVIFGTCPQLAVGPEGVISLLLHEVVVQVEEKQCEGKSFECFDDESTGHEVDQYMWALSFMVGAMCLLLGLVRAGFFSNLLSKPILNGFISASGLIIVGSQFDQLFGFCKDELTCDEVCTEEPPEGIQTYIQTIVKFANGCTNWWALLVGMCSIAAFLGLGLLKKLLEKRFPAINLLPSTFIVIIGGILVGYLTDLEHLRVLGPVKEGPPPPSLPNIFNLERFQLLIPHAITIVLVGFVEATAVAKAYSSKHNYAVSPNRELIAFGSLNLMGSFFSSYAVFSSLPRSRVADMAGARTTLSGLVAALICLMTTLFLLDLFQYLPYSCVAGVIICAASMLIEVHDIQALIILKAWLEFTLAVVVFLITFILGPTFGITAAVLMSAFMIVRRSTSLELVMLSPSGMQLEGDKVHPRKLDDGITIIRVDEPLHFGNCTQLKEIIRRIEVFGAPHIHPSADPTMSPLRGLIIHMKNTNTIDAESVSVFREIITEFEERGIYVHLVRLQEQPYDYLMRGRIIGEKGLLGQDCVSNSLSKSVKLMRVKVERKLMEEFHMEETNDGLDYSDLDGSEKPPPSQTPPHSGDSGILPREEDTPGSQIPNDGEEDDEEMFDRNAILMSFSNDDSVKKLAFRDKKD